LLSYFKINDPFRLLPLFILVFLLKLPAFLNPLQYTEATHWFVIGEAMQSGSMYIDIWDGMAPLSATLYQGIFWLFGRSILALLILGTLVTFIQAAIINNFSIRAKLFENNTYLPALIYSLLTSSHSSFFTLSPSLIGLTFVLLGLGKLLSHVEFRAKADIHILWIGLYFGISVLFYLPFIIIIPISIILLLIFSNTILRRYFLLAVTSFTPLIFAFFYYWVISDHLAYFISNFLKINNYDAYYLNIGWYNASFILSFSFLFFILGLVSIGKQRRLTNYQFRIVQLFLTLGVLMMSMFLLEKPITHYSLVVFVPLASYFTVHFTALFKRPLLIIILNIFLFMGPTLMLWSTVNSWVIEKSTSPDNSSLLPYIKIIKDKRIMVLGSAKDLYDESQLAGPFYDWGLSKPFFEELNYYDNLVFLQNQLTKSNPDIIIDLENSWPKISKSLPLISKKYYLSRPNVWVKRN
jgi:hypothetical protein